MPVPGHPIPGGRAVSSPAALWWSRGRPDGRRGRSADGGLTWPSAHRPGEPTEKLGQPVQLGTTIQAGEVCSQGEGVARRYDGHSRDTFGSSSLTWLWISRHSTPANSATGDSCSTASSWSLARLQVAERQTEVVRLGHEGQSRSYFLKPPGGPVPDRFVAFFGGAGSEPGPGWTRSVAAARRRRLTREAEQVFELSPWRWTTRSGCCEHP